jgi:cell division septation protein DedD
MKSRKPEDSIEEQLSLELENLYKEIEHPEKIDKIEVQGGREPDLGPAYELFKVEPDASHEELKEAYEELASAWNPKRFSDHPEWKDKAEKKLEIINKAYEMILSARIREIRKKRKTIQLGEIEKDTEPAYTRDAEENEDELEEEETPRRFGLKHALIFAGIPVFLLLCWFVVSPLFEKSPDNKTDKKAVSEKLPPLARNVQQMPVPDSKPADIKPEPNLKPETKAETVVEPPRVIEPPAPKPITKEQKSAPAALKPVSETKPQATKPSAKAAPKTEVAKKSNAPARMPFSIQVGAVKDRAKGLEYLGKVKKDGYNASLVETKLPSGEKGYRILVGGFQSRDEAFAYMTNKGLKQKYPGSFVQKNTP